MFTVPLRGAPPSGLLLLVCFEINPGPFVFEACPLAPSCISGPSFRFSYLFFKQLIGAGNFPWVTNMTHYQSVCSQSSLNLVLLKQK